MFVIILIYLFIYWFLLTSVIKWIKCFVASLHTAICFSLDCQFLRITKLIIFLAFIYLLQDWRWNSMQSVQWETYWNWPDVWWYILAYHETFKEGENNNITAYEQRAVELKSRLKRSHIIRLGSNKKLIKVQETIKVVFGIKCLEDKAYVARKNKIFSEDCEKNAIYHDLHDICRIHFDVPETICTYLGFYSGKKLGQFSNLGELSYTHKESRKKPLHIYISIIEINMEIFN